MQIASSQLGAEDAALDAARTDRRNGKSVLVICETSNARLDELNGRAQAIHHENGNPVRGALPVSGRPYALRAGDAIQIRRGTRHPLLGRVDNGTTGGVLHAHPNRARVRLADGRTAEWTREQVEQGDVRLAYVQHPFPAQGATSDTTHIITGQHPTRHGTYVALTRARHRTHLYASDENLGAVREGSQRGRRQRRRRVVRLTAAAVAGPRFPRRESARSISP